MKYPFFLFVQLAGLASQVPSDLRVKQAEARLLALAKWGVKGDAARDGGQTRDLHIAYQDKTPPKSLPAWKRLNGKTA